MSSSTEDSGASSSSSESVQGPQRDCYLLDGPGEGSTPSRKRGGGSASKKPRRRKDRESGASFLGLEIKNPADHWEALDSDNKVTLWLTSIGIDPTLYRARKYGFDPRPDQARNHGDALVFYFEFFREGLRLPLDPFVVEFLELFKAVPSDLQLSTVRFLVAFIVASRMLCCEPDMEVFRYLFIFSRDNKTRRITLRARSKDKFFVKNPNKRDLWYERPLLVESRHGWPFPKTELSEVCCHSTYNGPFTFGGNKLLHQLRRVTGHTGANPRAEISWKVLTTDFSLLRQTGVTRFPAGGEESRVLLIPEVVHPYWGNHHNGNFPSECVACAAGGLCRPPYSGIHFPRLFAHCLLIDLFGL